MGQIKHDHGQEGCFAPSFSSLQLLSPFEMLRPELEISAAQHGGPAAREPTVDEAAARQ